jgi:hypothetical protein
MPPELQELIDLLIAWAIVHPTAVIVIGCLAVALLIVAILMFATGAAANHYGVDVYTTRPLKH